MTNQILTPAVMEWAGRAAPGARVARCAVCPLAGGAVARRVDQVTLHLTGHHDPLELVRKQVPAHEIAGLRADVHPGNVIVHADQATLIDWGSSRIGPAALDLANFVAVGSADVTRYARTWQQLTGQPLSGHAIELGYRWAALQLPVQYLPWTIGHQPTRDVEAVLDQIEQALGQL